MYLVPPWNDLIPQVLPFQTVASAAERGSFSRGWPGCLRLSPFLLSFTVLGRHLKGICVPK